MIDELTEDLKLQVLYLSGDGDPLWFSTGKGSDELIPTGAFASLLIPHRVLLSSNFPALPLSSLVLIWGCAVALVGSATGPVYTLWKHTTLLPVLTTPASVIPVLVGGADLMVPGGAREIA